MKKVLVIALVLVLGIAIGGSIQHARQILTVPESGKAVQTQPDLADILLRVLGSTDVESALQSLLSAADIDLETVAQQILEHVTTSPELKREIEEYLRSDEALDLMLELANTEEFRKVMREIAVSKEFIAEMASSPEIQQMSKQMVLDAIRAVR